MVISTSQRENLNETKDYNPYEAEERVQEAV